MREQKMIARLDSIRTEAEPPTHRHSWKARVSMLEEVIRANLSGRRDKFTLTWIDEGSGWQLCLDSHVPGVGEGRSVSVTQYASHKDPHAEVDTLLAIAQGLQNATAETVGKLAAAL